MRAPRAAPTAPARKSAIAKLHEMQANQHGDFFVRLVEKNPSTLIAVFDVPAGTEPSLSTRIKMGQTSNVYALVKADGKYYVASKEIKVTLGGCGG